MKQYKKNIDNQIIIKKRQEIIIEKNGMTIFNPSEEMILEDGWEEYVYIKPEKNLEDYKRETIEEIKNYDASSMVNEFFINDISIWLDKTTRVGLKLRFESELVLGKNETILWYEGKNFKLNISDAINMLYGLELYASACYDNTQYHIATVNTLETIEEVQSYDYTINYPQKLKF